MDEILEEVRGIESESQLLHILNCTAPFDAQTQKDDVSSDFLIDSYEKSRNNFGRVEVAEGDELNFSQRSNDSAVNSNSLTGMVSQMINFTDDNILSDLLQQVSERARVLGK